MKACFDFFEIFYTHDHEHIVLIYSTVVSLTIRFIRRSNKTISKVRNHEAQLSIPEVIFARLKCPEILI
jgi:hypothetical protein